MDEAVRPCDQGLLQALVEGVEAETGDGFFRSLVRHLATTLHVSHCFVSELIRDGTYFRSLALWARGDFAENFEAPLEGTPCGAVLHGGVAFHPDGLQERFPEDAVLRVWGVVGYAGVPMVDANGVVVGHLAICHDQPLRDVERAIAVMRIFARRAVAEVERERASRAVRESEERLGQILASAMDAIVVFDREGRVVLFNPAAERVLRCPATEAIGTPVSRFTTEAGLASLEEAARRITKDAEARLFVDESEGLLARRADGTLFPFEATLSRGGTPAQPLYTVILRDIAERKKAAREHAQLIRQTQYLREEIDAIHPFVELVGRSPALQKTLENIELVGPTDSTTLIHGETGTGKELVARALHARSRRAARPLIKLNCAALPAGLVESELFGHEKGAFTGATQRHIGRFELAHQGTLFLDEIGELPLDAQLRLLRVLQEREFERVGGNATIRVDVRVLAATNRNLENAIRKGRFREDLYYRLNVFPISLPPLRERLDDVELLAHYFVTRHAPRIGSRATRLSGEVLERLAHYSWPGNVRELENVIERLLILSRRSEQEIGPELLALVLPTAGSATAAAGPGDGAGIGTLEEFERRHILTALESRLWRIEGPSGAARALGVRPSTLRSRMKKLGIQRSIQPS